MNPKIKNTLDKIYVDVYKLNYKQQYDLFDGCLRLALLSKSLTDYFNTSIFDRDIDYSVDQALKYQYELVDKIHDNFFSDIDIDFFHPTRDFTLKHNMNLADIIQFIYGIDMHVFKEKIRTSDESSFDSSIFVHNKDLLMTILFTKVFEADNNDSYDIIYKLVDEKTDLLDEEYRKVFNETFFMRDCINPTNRLKTLAEYIKGI